MAQSRLSNGPRLGVTGGLVANSLVLGVFAYAAVIGSVASDFYYRSVQEDEYLEWASFWAFLVAGVVFVLGAFRQHRAIRKLPWFLSGLAVFCFVVALEEISWGQRVFSYRPPTYFLEHNFQQEFNLHNTVASSFRQLALKAVILGYGVLLPLAFLPPAVGQRLSHAAMIGPPAALVPSFLATYIIYSWYPWTYSGEWVEIALGLGFLFSALLCAREYTASERSLFGSAHPALLLSLGWLLVVGLGLINSASSRSLRQGNPEIIETARLESMSLARDVREREPVLHCGLHKRLYTYKEEYDKSYLMEGRFSKLTTQGLPQARAEFFLDPWNSPYWLRARCQGERVSSFVYSLGPNRRRDSTPWEIGGDDIGAYIFRLPNPE